MIPPAKRVVRRYEVNVREVVNGDLNFLAAGCQRRSQSKGLVSPRARTIDSQSVMSADKSGARIGPPGIDAGKKFKGMKRHDSYFDIMLRRRQVSDSFGNGGPKGSN